MKKPCYLMLHTHPLDVSQCRTPPPGLMALFFVNCLSHTILLNDGGGAGRSPRDLKQRTIKANENKKEGESVYSIYGIFICQWRQFSFHVTDTAMSTKARLPLL